MRVAAIYDIHANLPALEAVLADIRQAKVDLVVVGGDVLPGPMPRETMERLLNLEIPTQFVRGNGDREVAEQFRGVENDALPEEVRAVVRWVAQQLPRDYERLLNGWAQSIRLRVPGLGDVLFCHATPRSDTELFTKRTSEERLIPVFERIDVDVVVCGHTHMQFERTVGRVRVLNSGSVGMPYGEPGAYWLLLGPDIQFRRTAYDFAGAAECIRATKYPQAEEFAAQNVMQPPSEEVALTAFGRAELR